MNFYFTGRFFRKLAGIRAGIIPLKNPRPYQPCSHLSSIACSIAAELSLKDFQQLHFKPEEPVILTKGPKARQYEKNTLPAADKWFQSRTATGQHPDLTQLSSYLTQFSSTLLPYELIITREEERETLVEFRSWLSQSHDVNDNIALQNVVECALSEIQHPSGDGSPRLHRFEAPLALFMAALRFNNFAMASKRPLTQLYIAQAPISDLPQKLQEDLPAPEIVRSSGRGDVYNTSIWLGLEPTYTPWHRDPNPNFFHQLCSSKVIRLLPPARGEAVFRANRMRLLRQALGNGASTEIAVDPHIRTTEMFQGPEREALHEAVWGMESEAMLDLREVRLSPGDSLFIPKGWWHSVKSAFCDGRLNASVNWWFR